MRFRSVQDCRKFFKNGKVDLETADAVTYGAASAFLEHAYLAPVRAFLADANEAAQCREHMEKLFDTQFSYFALLYCKEQQDGQNGRLFFDYPFTGFGQKDSPCRRLHVLGIYKSKRLFYEKMQQMMADVFAQKMQQAQEFKQMYQTCAKEIQKECMVTGEESRSVEAYYGKITEQFVERQQNADQDNTAFPDVFRVGIQKQELLGAVWEVFLKLVQESVFDCDFEQEVDARMDGMDEKLDAITEKVNTLAEKPAKRWESIVGYALSALVGAFLLWLASGLPGLK